MDFDPGKYGSYYQTLLDGAVPEQDAQKAVAEFQREDACLARGECPSCRKTVSRQADARQAGLSDLPGTWVKYRCGACGFMRDHKETN